MNIVKMNATIICLYYTYIFHFCFVLITIKFKGFIVDSGQLKFMFIVLDICKCLVLFTSILHYF